MKWIYQINLEITWLIWKVFPFSFVCLFGIVKMSCSSSSPIEIDIEIAIERVVSEYLATGQ